MSAIASLIGTLISAGIGALICLFLYKKGKKAGISEARVKVEEEKHAAAIVVNEVKQEVASELDTASDDHLVTVAHRWLRPSPTSDTKPN